MGEPPARPGRPVPGDRGTLRPGRTGRAQLRDARPRRGRAGPGPDPSAQCGPALPPAPDRAGVQLALLRGRGYRVRVVPDGALAPLADRGRAAAARIGEGV